MLLILRQADGIDPERAPLHRLGTDKCADQQSAIDAVIKDMSSAKPMDRLVCGDVGFGKTEVAMRAAFVAVMDGLCLKSTPPWNQFLSGVWFITKAWFVTSVK